MFTIVNGEDHFFANLIEGMLVNVNRTMGSHITAYTGSRTGGDFDAVVRFDEEKEVAVW